MFTTTDETIVWEHVKRARTELADYLSTLSLEQWDQPSLCHNWLIRDVLAHLILEYHYRAANSWKDYMLSGFNVNRFMRQTAIKLGREPPEELLKRYRVMINERQKPAAVSVINVLVDLLVHEQDIRIPLRQPKDMPLDSLMLVFSHWEPAEFNFGEKITGVEGRVKGLQFTATDIGITKGAGKIVKGPAQKILLAITGRNACITNLKGDGVALLKNRLN